MAGDVVYDLELEDDSSKFVEVDPSGRYGRYPEVLGKGASKIVFKAFDELEGIEVAWNQVKLKDIARSSKELERFHSELHLLKTLKHKNIMKFYGSWVDVNSGNVNFITEVFTSGNLRQYRMKHKHVDIRALKNWARQVLEGLYYLHSHDPPIIHRDIKCENIFINGSYGEVKIGDLGLAAILHNAQCARSIIGTPEFMAPEFYMEEYNELVDIYAFGMCLLELVTFEYPYVECLNSAQIYRNVTMGIQPASLMKVKDPEVKRFIEMCIANVSERLPASELLKDPFLQITVMDHHINNFDHLYSDESSQNRDAIASFSDEPSIKDFIIEGQRQDSNTIFLKLRIVDSTGQVHNIHFPFDVETDTPISVASEMVAELDLTDQDVTTIAMTIDSEIKCHIPDWMGETFSFDGSDDEAATEENVELEVKDKVFDLPRNLDLPPRGFVLERLPSGHKYWSDSPRGGSPTTTKSNVSSGKEDSQLGYNHQEVHPLKVPSSQKHPNSTPNMSLPPSDSVLEQLPSGRKYSSRGSPTLAKSNVSSGKEDSHLGHNHQKGQPLNTPSSQNHLNPVHLANGVHNKDNIPNINLSSPVELSTSTDNLPSENGKRTKNEQGHVKLIVEKLESLLDEQKQELQKLKKKHDHAIADVLKVLPPEFRRLISCKCKLKISDGVEKAVHG